MTRLMAPARPWLVALGWLVGIALFVRLTQILPCCTPPTLESALHGHNCDLAFAAACPSYDDCAPR